MKKIFLFVFVFLMAVSLILGAQGDNNPTEPQGGDNSLNLTQGEQGTGSETQSNVEAQNRVRVRSGNYTNSNGEQMQIQSENGFKLKVGGVEAKSSLEINQEEEQGVIKLKTELSNGKYAEIKFMPNTASETAIERLQLQNCNSENNCSIELKEVGKGEEAKLAYEVEAKKDAKVLGMFKAKMKVKAQVDAETGEVIKTQKRWWAFLASE